jgi:hypothetical protein
MEFTAIFRILLLLIGLFGTNLVHGKSSRRVKTYLIIKQY